MTGARFQGGLPATPPEDGTQSTGPAGKGDGPGDRVFDCENIRLQADLCGENDRNLAAIEQKLNVTLFPRGDRIEIKGKSGAPDLAHGVLTRLARLAAEGRDLDQGAVDGAIRMVMGGGQKAAGLEHISIRTQKRAIEPRTPLQADYIKALMRSELVFALGPAGTGKTYLAVAYGVSLLINREVDRLILSRPAVEAGERLGFLPGDMREKVDPYLRPLFDALQDTMIGDQVQRRMDAGEIEVAPLAFMRGRTLAHSFIILDEAQNTTPMQMKMVLTRLGEGARMVITGDPSQVDLPDGHRSGLDEALNILKGVPGIDFIRFTEADVVRHPLVARIVRAYDRAHAQAKGRQKARFRDRDTAQTAAESGPQDTDPTRDDEALATQAGVVPPPQEGDASDAS